MASQQRSSETVEQMMLAKKNPGEEPPQENEQDQSEICPSKSDEGHVKGDMEKRTLHPLTLLKDDLMKVFKGKGAKTEHEDVKCEDLQSQRAENALSLFKEDFNQFKDDLSSVFRIGLSKDKDKKDDLKRVQSVERTHKLFKKEQRNLPEQNERETRSPEEMNNNTSPPEDSEPHANGSEDTTEETTGRATGSSCQTSSSDNQKPPEAKSALTVKDQEHDLASESDQTDPRESRTIGLLSLLTEDWFKVPGQSRPSTQTENKPTIGTSSLLTCDSTQLSVSSSMDKDVARAETKTSQTAEKSVVLMNRLSLLKDDLSNVLRVSLSKEKDNKEDSFRIKVLQTERTDDSFGRDPKPLKSILWDRPLKPEDRQEVKNMLSGRKEEQGDCGFQQNLPEQNKENHGAEKTTIIDRIKRPEDSGQENVSEETMCSSNTGRPKDFFKNLLRREQEVKIMLSENKEAHLDCEHLEQTEQNADAEKDGTPGDRELTLHVSEERAETSEEMMCTSSTGGPRDFLKNLFRRDPKPLRPPEKPEDSQEVRNMLSERKEEQRDPEQYEDREVDLNVSDDNENNHRDSDEREQDDDQDVKVQDSLKTNQKSTISPLTLLKEDFSHFKEDLLSVLRISPPKEKDSNEDAFKIKVLCAERNEEPCKRAEEPDVPELVEETRDTKTKSNSEEGTDRTDDERIRVEEEARPPQTLPWDSSETGVFSLTHATDMRAQPGGGLWSPKDFATYLTFDPNTANSELLLSNGNRAATRVWSDHLPSDHPDRFERCPQVLCREGLLDPVYWEVEWRGGADIGVAYNSISRGDALSCLLGHNERSWSLECSEGSYTPCYNNRRFSSSSPEPFTHRVAVYLDWPAGTLSFYCVSQDTLVHLHTFTSNFTEPLYAGFWIWAYEGSVSLCQVELDWERLQ